MNIYHYLLLQYVGDPARSEAVNLGVAVLDSRDGQARVRFDRGAATRIRRSWPQFDRVIFRSFVRDLQAALGIAHQADFGEQPRRIAPTVETMRALAEAASNQFRLLGPERWAAESLDAASRELYERLVRERPRQVERPRHMNRSELRDLVSGILRGWAQTRSEEVEIEADRNVAGALAQHPVDLVASRGQKPEHFFFVVPLGGGKGRARLAGLIRDALPTAVDDIRQLHHDAHFYAVVSEAAGEETERFRTFLSPVAGLDVMSVEEVEQRFQGRPALV